MRYYFIRQRMEASQLPHTVLNRPLEVVNFPRGKMVKEIGKKAYGYAEYRKFISDVAQGLFGLSNEFGDTPWYHDSITEEFIERHIEELREPKKMSEHLLAEALTYMNGAKYTVTPNIYERELARRAGMLKKLDSVRTKEEKRELIHAAAAVFGITFG